METLHEECAVFGVSLKEGEEAPGLCYNGLLALQHRGQEGAGIAAARGNALTCQKGLGLVSEAFPPAALAGLPAAGQAIGHARYSTTGANTLENVQPFVTEYLTGRIATAHNGNVTNARSLREKLRPFGLEFPATSDSQVVSSLIAYMVLRKGDFFTGVREACKLLQGAFSLVVLSGDGRLAAVRDPNGYRPLCLGESREGLAVASESCALDSCGFTFLRDVAPGEIVLLERGKLTHSERCLTASRQSLCVFEYVYFARPDSVIDGLSVYEARLNMGRALAREHPVEADLVCGVPDSGLEAAMGYALESGIPYASGFVKNRYIGRSFIFPTQAQREHAVDLKLNPPAVGGGQAGGAGGRLHRPGDHLRQNRLCHAPGRGERGPPAHLLPSLYPHLPLRHGHWRRGEPHRQPADPPGDRGPDRRGHPGLHQPGGAAAGLPGQPPPPVRRLLYRPLRHPGGGGGQRRI